MWRRICPAFVKVSQARSVLQQHKSCIYFFRRCIGGGGSFHPPKRSQKADEAKIVHAYLTLQLPIGTTTAQIRERYLILVKQHHPDVTGSDDSDEFQRIRAAYAYLSSLQNEVLQRAAAHAKEKADRGESSDFTNLQGNSGTVPASASSQPVPNAAHSNTVQHRSYLRNEGVGYGTNVFVRENQYRQHKLSRGKEGVIDYQMNKLSREMEALEAEMNKNSDGSTSSDKNKEIESYDSLLAITRATHASPSSKSVSQELLIEEQIKAAISTWDPKTLKDFGKPLEHLERDSGSMDPLEAKLNAILHANGALPEWLELEKHITSEYTASVEEIKFVWNELVSHEQYHAGVKKKQQEELQKLKSGSSNLAGGSSAENELNMTLAYPSIYAVTPTFESTVFGACWQQALSEFHSSLKHINAHIDEFNCSVPSAMNRQRIHYSFADVVRDIESTPPNEQLVGAYHMRSRNHSRRVMKRGSKSGAQRKNAVLGHNKLITNLAGAAADDTQLGIRFQLREEEGERKPKKDASGVVEQMQQQQLQQAAPASARSSVELSTEEMEELYRSLSPVRRERVVRKNEEDANLYRASKQPSELSLPVVMLLAFSTGLFLILPVYVNKRQKKRAEQGE